MNTLDWLLDSDPAIRWQTLRDLTDAAPDVVAAERTRVATEGWGAQVLARQATDGSFGGSADSTGWNETNIEWNCLLALAWLREMGLDPAGAAARSATELVARNITWKWFDDRPFFTGEVEPCINGRVLALAAYFGHDPGDLVSRLVGEQMVDGGWNCEQENGSVRGSFHSTINVLEGLREWQLAHGSDDVAAALDRGESYLLERGLMRRLTSGEVIDPEITQLGFPTGYHYDVLRALDYFRWADRHDERLAEALEVVEGKRGSDGRWSVDVVWPDQLDIGSGNQVGEPSGWLTLHALRVLRWKAGHETARG